MSTFIIVLQFLSTGLIYKMSLGGRHTQTKTRQGETFHASRNDSLVLLFDL